MGVVLTHFKRENQKSRGKNGNGKQENDISPRGLQREKS